MASWSASLENVDMTLRVEKKESGRHLHISIEGNFTFGLYREFLDAVDQCGVSARLVTIDLEKTDYIDSAALGLMIQAEHKLSSCKTMLRVRKGSIVDEILMVTNFEKLFKIEAA